MALDAHRSISARLRIRLADEGRLGLRHIRTFGPHLPPFSKTKNVPEAKTDEQDCTRSAVRLCRAPTNPAGSKTPATHTFAGRHLNCATALEPDRSWKYGEFRVSSLPGGCPAKRQLVFAASVDEHSRYRAGSPKHVGPYRAWKEKERVHRLAFVL